MKITHSKPKGQRRMKSTYIHICGRKVKRPLWIESEGLWFNNGTWETEPKNGSSSAYYSMKGHGFHNVYSLKAAKRLIHKWNMPKGTKFHVSLLLVGFEFTITT